MSGDLQMLMKFDECFAEITSLSSPFVAENKPSSESSCELWLSTGETSTWSSKVKSISARTLHGTAIYAYIDP